MFLVLILLLIGGLIATPLLAHMGTGILAGEVYEKRTAELYAADAGVEDAIWSISHQTIESWEWQESDEYPGWWVYEYPELLIVNDRSVDITLYKQDLDPTCGEELVYRILATAMTEDGGGVASIATTTTVEAYLSASYMDFSSLLDNAIVSYDTINLKGDTVVDGDIWLPDEEDLDTDPNVTINGTVRDEDDMSITWPTAEQLSSYYLEYVEGHSDTSSSIDIKYTPTIGPCCYTPAGGTLEVDNTGDPATLVLEGTVYVTGNLDFQQSGSHEYTVDLNGHTIFVEGEIVFPAKHVSISGPGCIIAIGDIDFQPAIEGDEFVLVMSIAGKVNFQPSGDFTGCIAGNAHVELKPGNTINWISPEGKGLDFPMGVGDDDELPPVTGVRIESWEVSQQ